MSTNSFHHSIVLRTVNYKESDIIASLLTDDLGRISCIVKGARNSKRRFMGGVDILDCAMCELAPLRRNSSLYFLNSITSRTHWPGLRENLLGLSVASFCLEVCNDLLAEGDPDGGLIFGPLHEALERLNVATTIRERYLTGLWFTLALLDSSGFSPLLNQTLAADQKMRDFWHSVSQQHSSIKHYDELWVRSSFLLLMHYAEEILDRRLRTRELLLREFANAS